MIGIDAICENIETGHNIKITPYIREKVEALLLIETKTKTFSITSTINIEAKDKEDAEYKFKYKPEQYMNDLYENAEIDEL